MRLLQRNLKKPAQSNQAAGGDGKSSNCMPLFSISPPTQPIAIDHVAARGARGVVRIDGVAIDTRLHRLPAHRFVATVGSAPTPSLPRSNALARSTCRQHCSGTKHCLFARRNRWQIKCITSVPTGCHPGPVCFEGEASGDGGKKRLPEYTHRRTHTRTSKEALC